jgi:3-deoxy-7-phosphoheptulonate synthase
MIIQLQPNVSTEDLQSIQTKLHELKLSHREVVTQSSRYLIALGDVGFDIRDIGHLAGVMDVYFVPDSYQLVSRKWRVHPSKVQVGDDVVLTEGALQFMLGPCSIESEDQMEQIARFLRDSGVKIMRGGAFKPRSSPYSFQGLGIEGLKLMHDIARQYGLKVISEVVEPSQVEQMHDHIDIYQVGTRNAQNFSLLHELGKVDKAVLIKRGMSGTIEELLNSAEYVYANGNERILLCERGIRTYEKAYRNTLDINAIPILKERTHLPVIVDPSHGIGIRQFVESVTLAAIAAGADGILGEIHPYPEEAKSDGFQTLNFEEARRLIQRGRAVFEVLREVN